MFLDRLGRVPQLAVHRTPLLPFLLFSLRKSSHERASYLRSVVGRYPKSPQDAEAVGGSARVGRGRQWNWALELGTR